MQGTYTRFLRKPMNLNDQVGKIKLTYPVLKAAKLDMALRQLLMAQLISMNVKEGQGVLVPTGTNV